LTQFRLICYQRACAECRIDKAEKEVGLLDSKRLLARLFFLFQTAMNTDGQFLLRGQNEIRKTIITSNPTPLPCALRLLLLGIAALWVIPKTAHAQLALSGNVAQTNAGSIGAYNASTGPAANFITGLSDTFRDLAVSGSTLFVAEAEARTVGAYNADMGAAINASFFTMPGPQQSLKLAVSGKVFFAVNASGTNLISWPYRLWGQVDSKQILYVSLT
jgi:hypothetical protein